MSTYALALLAVLAPLAGALLAGLFGKTLGRSGSHSVTILGVALSCLASLWLVYRFFYQGEQEQIHIVYQWAQVGAQNLHVGFWLDRLTVVMMAVVTFVSLNIHVYTIGYMHDDPGYQRFFSYISLFTFAMLMLVMADNFLQLFFGWEAVGLVSYLLIGFWFTRESAIRANLKAFLMNRIGDLGFLLGIALIYHYYGTLDYQTVFAHVDDVLGKEYILWGEYERQVRVDAATLICLLLFVGAMGKSAQMPLHAWLPDSMEGPTPISALIHAATMVTAGIFMVARLSPLYELSDAALNIVMFVGVCTAFFMGLLGLVQNDIKRVIAYSTLSQLGYMTVALGASAYSIAVFHLLTHAFFKALLFLAAGSVIVALHHQQDMRRMGGLHKHMPITSITALLGTLALVGFPGTSGFFSKEAIIEAVHYSTLPAAHLTHLLLLVGVFITALYSFRLWFMVFWGSSRASAHNIDHQHQDHAHAHAHAVHESPATITLPLLVLAVPSILIGAPLAGAAYAGDLFATSMFVADAHTAMRSVSAAYHGVWAALSHGLVSLPFILVIAAALLAYVLYGRERLQPLPGAALLTIPRTILVEKYGFDHLYEKWLPTLMQLFSQFCSRLGDRLLIDGLMVNGSARLIGASGLLLRRLQTGYLYHYVFIMLAGLLALIAYFTLRIGAAP